ncbi:DUF6215 domain-containing protein [Streptomyces sp. NPDC048718]|uniref:DUF6215 domain-containing protein n=1 Tax=Streptomyces sp. NPDC048718 TaxID=3365587 RepID=UPI00371E28FD
MLGFLVRRLPFWVREPLLIVVGSAFGVRIMYLAVSERSWKGAGIGALVLVFTAVRVYTVVKAVRALRNPEPAALAAKAAAGTAAPQPVPLAQPAVSQSLAGADQRPTPPAPEKEPGMWGQVVAALVVCGALAGALWVVPHVMAADDNTPRPVSCTAASHEELPKPYEKTPHPVTGEELCEALYRPDLARILGTPGETATGASGLNNTAPLTEGKIARPEAQVTFPTYTVNVSATYNKLSTHTYVELMTYGSEQAVKKLKVAGRPAVLFSDHTMKLRISLGSSGSSGPVEQGPLARTLSVALAPEDHGGYYEITVWSESGALPDDGALIAIAEKVIPKAGGHTDH